MFGRESDSVYRVTNDNESSIGPGENGRFALGSSPAFCRRFSAPGSLEDLLMNAGFTKLFSSIVTSSLWVQPDPLLRVWIAMLATCDSKGEVAGSIPGFASLCRITVEEMRECEAKLLQPDPDSRTKSNEGRRIEKVEGGWRIINYKLYREKGQDKEGSRAAYMRQYRDCYALQHGVTRGTEAEAEADVQTQTQRASVTRNNNNDAIKQFEAFWKAYPRKTHRYDAEHAFVEVDAAKHMDEILPAIERQKGWEIWNQDGGRFIPNPANWLRDGRWHDKPPECGYQKSIL